MDDAGLDHRHRERRLDGFGEALEAVAARDQDVLHASGLELVDDLQPKFRALGLLDPEPQDFLAARQSHAERDVDGLVADDALVADFHDEDVEVDDRVDRVQGSRLPGRHVLGYERHDP